MIYGDLNFEGDIAKRIEKAKAAARAIVDGSDNSLDGAHFVLRAILSKRYNMPIFHEYFENKSFDELVFEIEIFNALEETNTKRGSNALKENKAEAESLFDDWAEDDAPVDPSVTDEWTDAGTTSKGEIKQWDKETEEFMKTGKFKGE